MATAKTNSSLLRSTMPRDHLFYFFTVCSLNRLFAFAPLHRAPLPAGGIGGLFTQARAPSPRKMSTSLFCSTPMSLSYGLEASTFNANDGFTVRGRRRRRAHGSGRAPRAVLGELRALREKALAPPLTLPPPRHSCAPLLCRRP